MINKEKIIELIKKNIIYIVLIFLPLAILFIAVRRFDYSTIEKADIRTDAYTDVISLDKSFSQDFWIHENNLRQINLYCGTYERVVDSILDIKITDKETNKIIFDNKIFTAGISDNSTTPLYFDIQENSKDRWYNITITCDEMNSEQGFSFALIKSNEKNNNGVDLTPSHIVLEKNSGEVINDVSKDFSLKIDYVYANINIKLKIVKWLIVIFGFIITIGMSLHWANRNKNTENKYSESIQNVINICILILFTIIVCIWITSNKITVRHPDEIMRISLPFYIYENNELPLPRDPQVLHCSFNASYAYYPLFITSIIAAGFMKIATIFGYTSNFELVVAIRLVSLLSGLISVVFLMKICKKIFKKDIIVRYFVVMIGAFIPQFIYLSSYFNNDIASVCASAIMVYSWILVLEEGWNVKRAILLSIGIIICALSYYNAYSWILLSAVIFIITFIKKININSKHSMKIEVDNENKAIDKIKSKKYEFDFKNFLKYGIIISILVLACISYFFIRNIIVLDGDMLGMKSFLAACEESDNISQRPSQRNTPKNLGYSYWHMFTSTEWIGLPWYKATYQSFICLLGGSTEPIDNWVYNWYAIIFSMCIIGFIIKVIIQRKDISKNEKILYSSLFFASSIVFALSLKYSYDTDYQPQGRYVYPMWIAFMIFIGKGFEYIFEILKKFIKKELLIKLIKVMSVTAIVMVILYIQLIATNINISFQNTIQNTDISDFDKIM